MEDIKVTFYDGVDDKRISFVVICTKYKDQWVWVKHKERVTYELPGGHREHHESALDGAKRELEEETGASAYHIQEICAYSVCGKTRVNDTGEETFGMLYLAQVFDFGELHSEIESIAFFDDIPTSLTYPLIQPILMKQVHQIIQVQKQ